MLQHDAAQCRGHMVYFVGQVTVAAGDGGQEREDEVFEDFLPFLFLAGGFLLFRRACRAVRSCRLSFHLRFRCGRCFFFVCHDSFFVGRRCLVVLSGSVPALSEGWPVSAFRIIRVPLISVRAAISFLCSPYKVGVATGSRGRPHRPESRRRGTGCRAARCYRPNLLPLLP